MPFRLPITNHSSSRYLLKISQYGPRSRQLRSVSRVGFPLSQRASLSIPTRRSSKPGYHDNSLHNPLDPIEANRIAAERRAYYTRRSYYAATGAVLCMIATLVLISTYELPPKPERSDGPSRSLPGSTRLETGKTLVSGATGGVELRKVGTSRLTNDTSSEGEAAEQVLTGTSTIPSFPKYIMVPSAVPSTTPTLPSGTGDANQTYQLIGLGIRTVSFLSIQVYVVGLYVASTDIATLQSRMVHKATGVEAASTLVAGERDELRKMLLDPGRSERVWSEVLGEGGLRTVLRIVPTRNTDFGHLRDGFVRSITSRSQGKLHGDAMLGTFDDDGFGKAIADFKALFSAGGKKNVGLRKGQVLMLVRESDGSLQAWVEGENAASLSRMGAVQDERISRLLWLGYLGGQQVASDSARKSIVDGVLDFVERPVGTVETQVV